MDGTGKYVLHFTKDELPPVNAFWSVTMYDANGFQAANPINRFAIGDRDTLKYNTDVISAWMPTNQPGADLDARSAGRSPNHRDVVSQSSV